MDMTKAFDLVKSILFLKFLCSGLSPKFIRVIIFVYVNQFVTVHGTFLISLVWCPPRGAILSGFAYCFYINNLFAKLRKNKSGCWVCGTTLGILVYSDDSLLRAPSLDALQEMVVIT